MDSPYILDIYMKLWLSHLLVASNRTSFNGLLVTYYAAQIIMIIIITINIFENTEYVNRA